tara:strand:+ start:372 stop:611 length:240 start_codon:yes stop_codon:yes gene_type:complete
MLSHNQRLIEARNVEDQPKVNKITFIDPSGLLSCYAIVDGESKKPFIIDGVFHGGYNICTDIASIAVVEFYGYYEEYDE